jgi:hypothetical protein
VSRRQKYKIGEILSYNHAPKQLYMIHTYETDLGIERNMYGTKGLTPFCFEPANFFEETLDTYFTSLGCSELAQILYANNTKGD